MQNRQRKRVLDVFKTEKTKKRRVQLKQLRVQDGQQRVLWLSQHGEDTYGKGDKKVKKNVCKMCGSDKHALPTHNLCPYNKKHNKEA